jgi:hypothetical protein
MLREGPLAHQSRGKTGPKRRVMPFGDVSLDTEPLKMRQDRLDTPAPAIHAMSACRTPLCGGIVVDKSPARG